MRQTAGAIFLLALAWFLGTLIVSPDVQAIGPETVITLSPSLVFTAVLPKADIQLTMNASPQTVMQNGQVTYTLVLKNVGTLKADSASLTMEFDTPQTVEGTTSWQPPARGSSGCHPVAGSNAMTCSFVEMDPGDMYTITRTVGIAAPPGSTVTASALATMQGESNTNNNSATAVVKVAGPGTVVIGLDMDPEPDPTDIQFTDNIPNCVIGPLDDDPTSSTPESVTCQNVPPGSYQVTQSANPQYHLLALNCGDNDNGTTTNGLTANLDVDPGETVSCFFLNQRNPTTPTATATATATSVPPTATTAPPTQVPIAPTAPGPGSVATQTPEPATVTATPTSRASATPRPTRTPSTTTPTATPASSSGADSGGGGNTTLIVLVVVLLAGSGLGGGYWYTRLRKP